MTTRTGHHRAALRNALIGRQQDMLAVVAHDRTNAEIAEELGIGFESVKSHVSEILGKLGLDSREQAVGAWRSGQGIRAHVFATWPKVSCY